jgi:plasmid stability protein
VNWRRSAMNLSIKNVPDDLAERLRQRAKRNHRSLQGELLAIVSEALSAERQSMPEGRVSESMSAMREDRTRDFVVEPITRRTLTVREAREHMRALGVRTQDEAAQMIREDRDSH